MIEATNSDDSSDFVFFEMKSLNVHTAITMAKASTPFITSPLFGRGLSPNHHRGNLRLAHHPIRVALTTTDGSPG